MKKIGLFFFLLFLVGCSKTSYNIKFIDWDGSIIEEYNLKENDQIKSPDAPIREGYNFIGWDKEFDKASNDLIIQAQYEIQTFTVKFIGFNNEILKVETVEYGKNATAPTVTNYGEYLFSKWDKEFTNVKSNLEVKAIYKEKEYTIKFYDGTKELIFDVSTYKKGDSFPLPIPTKVGHEFIGWFLSEISLYEISQINDKLSGDLKLYSRWVKTEQDKLVAPNGAIEFEAINKNPHSSGNGYVYQPKFPSGVKSTSVTQYDWASSNEKVAKISAYSSISVVSTGYAIITGTLKTDPSYILYCVIKTSADGVVKVTLEEANATNYVYVTFNLDDGTSIKKVVAKGGYVIPPTATAKAGYTFVGWEGLNGETIYNINKDTTFVAKYVEGSKSYLGKTISLLGDSITTYAGYIPEGFPYFYPYPTADLGDVNQTWWMQFINHYGMKLLANNAYSGSAVAGSDKSATQYKERLQHLFIGQIIPDVILIFIGANDAGSPYITLTQFDTAYGTMIKNIKEMAPSSEIILCTLPSIDLYSEQEQVEYNEVIKKYANQNQFTLIDFEKAFTRSEISQYLVDKAHPNKAGMDKLANVAIKDLLK